MAKRDSIDKIVQSYFAAVTTIPFVYKGKTYKPKDLILSDKFFRGYKCFEKCGGCCPRFSLDYIKGEELPKVDDIEDRVIDFNGKSIKIKSITQFNSKDYYCKYLDRKTGLCTIHYANPFSCAFELTKFIQYKDEHKPTIAITKLFGRGWNMLKIDNERGAICEITPITIDSINDIIIKLERLKKWCEHFKLPNKCDSLIAQCEEQKNKYKNKLI